VVVAVAVAAVALAGAAVNLWLLEPHGTERSEVLVTGAPTSSSTSAPMAPPATSAAAPSTTTDLGDRYDVGGAGRLRVALVEGQVVVDEIEPAPGWSYEVDDDGDKVEIRFRRDGEERRLEAELRDGQLRVDVEAGHQPDD
jgi:uncharacterized protein YcnI